jgi:hypothetical protein
MANEWGRWRSATEQVEDVKTKLADLRALPPDEDRLEFIRIADAYLALLLAKHAAGKLEPVWTMSAGADDSSGIAWENTPAPQGFSSDGTFGGSL